MKFRVHTAVDQKVERQVTLEGGQKVQALVDGMVVELVEVDGPNSITLRFVPEDIGEARALYAQDTVLTLTFAPEEE